MGKVVEYEQKFMNLQLDGRGLIECWRSAVYERYHLNITCVTYLTADRRNQPA
jgi:hypothetical protein